MNKHDDNELVIAFALIVSAAVYLGVGLFWPEQAMLAVAVYGVLAFLWLGFRQGWFAYVLKRLRLL